ncbi:hybrid sensor histidine kinase/response regulator transcription factor [Tenacibaculum sp. TC6]|uniref:hybrid sensor histidine kinase/response regulator transcription factor n=1 Tax=Tenacibaculum sp. TC6 TaxID=3423223 RepID=UPI003D367E38
MAQKEVSFNVKHYDVNDGLSNDWISDIFQDEDGYIWLGTQYGLNRFDGKKFTIFTYVPGDSTALKANWVKSITQVGPDLYVGTFGGGVTKLAPYQETFTLLPTNNSKENSPLIIHDVLPEDANLLISSSSGIYSYTTTTQQLQSLYTKRVANIHPYKEKLQVATQNVIFELDGKKIEREHEFNEEVLNFFQISADSMLVYLKTKLLLVHKKETTWKRETLKFTTNYQSVLESKPFMYRDIYKNIWVNAGDTIYRFSSNIKTGKLFNAKELLGIAHSEIVQVVSMFQDKEHNYWFGTNLGLYQLIPHKPFRHPVLGHNEAVREVIETPSKIWFTTSEGLYVWNTEQKEKKLISQQHFKSICYASDGYLYAIGKTPKGISAIVKIEPKKETVEFITNEGLNPNFDWDIIEDGNHRLWISQWNRVQIYNLKTNEFFEIPILTKSNIGIVAMYRDQDDTIWIGTTGAGLFKVTASGTVTATKHKIKNYEYNPNNVSSISSNIVQAIHQNKDGLLWLGTDGGLNSLNVSTDKFTRYLRKDGMVNDKIYGITNDTSGQLWLSTASSGIIAFNPNNDEFTNFTQKDGLYGNSMLLGAVYKNEQGTIWMGAERGLHYFNPKELKSTDKQAPKLLVTSYKIHRKDTVIEVKYPLKNNQQVFQIHPEDQNVTFIFEIPTFEKNEDIRFQFYIKGYHNNWLPPKEEGSITLSNLPKGNYQLHVKAYTLNKGWQIHLPTISIKVIPIWYQSNTAYVAYAILMLLLATVLYKLQLQKKVAHKEKELVQALAVSKNNWFNQIAHEFRTPLTVIFNALEQLQEKKAHQKIHISQIQHQADYLDKQIEQILEIARLQDNQLKIEEIADDFVAFVKNNVASFSSVAESKQLTLSCHCSHDTLVLQFDHDKWNKILMNLISNAIKYTKEKGNIKVVVTYKDSLEELTVIVQDSGIGMGPDFLRKLFEPFSKEHKNNTKGVGLGLTLTKELVELLGGTIRVESIKEIGTQFIIQQHTPKVEASLHKEQHLFPISMNDEIPLLLIAEDHEEIRSYLITCLQPYYTVIVAHNGKEAWELCEKHVPDLVVSDIMMPEWDGIQLGRKLKETTETNHIPLLLLTAKSSKEDQLTGFKIGADAYIIKPFHKEELLLRVKNLIDSRQKIQQSYQQNIETKVDNVAIQGFMEKALQCVKTHMHDENFGVPQLATSMNLSRVHLYRKMKNLTGVSPSKYIRKVKLDQAKHLLKEKELTIAEIAYKTGFKDPSYFTKVFIEEYGKAPSTYRETI